jgi:nucleotide-binding universal stress UspA family protein
VIELKHVLSPVDFSDVSARPLAHAAALARWYGAKLSVLHVAPTFDPVPVRSGLGLPLQVAQPLTESEVLSEIRRLLDAGGISQDAVPVVRAGDPATTIVDEAVTNRADLIVMGTHGRRGFNRLLLGSVAETVLRHAPCPVLTVPPHASAESAQVVTVKRILCPMDFSPSALQAFGFALDLARQSSGTVTLLRVVEWLAEEEPRTSAHFNVPEFRRHMLADAEERLSDLAASESKGSPQIETVVAAGRAYREVLRTAEENAIDLIVMGAQGRGGVGLALFGSTTQQVVRGAACPVLTVRATPEA